MKYSDDGGMACNVGDASAKSTLADPSASTDPENVFRIKASGTEVSRFPISDVLPVASAPRAT